MTREEYFDKKSKENLQKKTIVINWMISYFKENNDIPKQLELVNTSFPFHSSFIGKNFGNYKNLLNECNIPLPNRNGYTEKQIHNLNCKTCGNSIIRSTYQLRENNFCSNSCAVKFTHKKGSYKPRRISKFEQHCSKELLLKYPKLEFIFNNRTKVGLELDIYIPELFIAIEIQGIYHYKPIYGDEKFQRTIKNDKIKAEQCRINNIKLYMIDISMIGHLSVKLVNPKMSQIISIIDSHYFNCY